MKLIGSKRNGRRVAARGKAAGPYKQPKKPNAAKPTVRQAGEQDAELVRRRKRRVRIIVSAISFAALAGCLVLFNYVRR